MKTTEVLMIEVLVGEYHKFPWNLPRKGGSKIVRDSDGKPICKLTHQKKPRGPAMGPRK